MESTMSTAANPPTKIISRAALLPIRSALGLMFRAPHLRPPVFEEVIEDVERVIHKIADRYQDQSCPELHFDELVAEGRTKLTHVLTKVEFRKVYNRVSFFKFFTTAFANHARSLVHKHRFTHKRTGVKPPPKDERFTGEPRMKTAEVRLDDEELHMQVSERENDERETNLLLDDFDDVLMPLERVIMRQLAFPNEHALNLAKLDAYRGLKPGDAVKIKIRTEHLAAGLAGEGLKLGVKFFEETVLSVRDKIALKRSMTSAQEANQTKVNAAIATLEAHFNLQIPRGTDPMIVKRLLTIAARDQWEAKVKGQEQIQELLTFVGAKAPRPQGSVLQCYGVLYEKNNRHCSACGLRAPCQVEAANYGLGKIKLSPNLLGAKTTRVPAILPGGFVRQAPLMATEDQMEIMAYLTENFSETTRKGETFYMHREKVGAAKVGAASRFLFQVTTHNEEFRVRFVNPSTNFARS
jgi:hypothetical protein